MLRKLIVQVLLVTFTVSCLGPIQDAHAQTLLDLPVPGQMVPISYSFKPLELKGIQVNVKNPLSFDFLVDKGQTGLQGQVLKDEITKLSKYFLTCLTIPEKDLWVNLSPYEKNRIAAPEFGVTEMGKSLLEQDYLLKQIMASLSYPENRIGKEFWQKVYKRSQELFGTTDIPVFSFNKVWILPESAEVYVNGNGAFVTNSKLNVMLEADYNALTHHSSLNTKENNSKASKLYADIMREIIVPLLKQEVNTGKNFAVVRQVYTAMILATWYKRHLKDSFLGKMYVGKKKVEGVDVEDKDIKEKIFQQYLKAYKKCVYNYIKEDYDPASQTTVARKYTSGGMDFAMVGLLENRIYKESFSRSGLSFGSDLAMATVNITGTNQGRFVEVPDLRLFSNTFPLVAIPRELALSAAMSIKRNFLSILAIPILFGFAGSFTKASAEEAPKKETQIQKVTLNQLVDHFADKNHWQLGQNINLYTWEKPTAIPRANLAKDDPKKPVIFNILSTNHIEQNDVEHTWREFIRGERVSQIDREIKDIKAKLRAHLQQKTFKGKTKLTSTLKELEIERALWLNSEEQLPQVNANAKVNTNTTQGAVTTTPPAKVTTTTPGDHGGTEKTTETVKGGSEKTVTTAGSTETSKMATPPSADSTGVKVKSVEASKGDDVKTGTISGSLSGTTDPLKMNNAGSRNDQTVVQGTPKVEETKSVTDLKADSNTGTTQVAAGSPPPPPEPDETMDNVKDPLGTFGIFLLIGTAIAGVSLVGVWLNDRKKYKTIKTISVPASNTTQTTSGAHFRVMPGPPDALSALAQSRATQGSSGGTTGKRLYKVQQPASAVTALESMRQNPDGGNAAMSSEKKSLWERIKSYIRPTDIAGTLLGAGIAAYGFVGGGIGVTTLGIATIVSFVATRLIYAGQIFSHENGHNVIGFFQSLIKYVQTGSFNNPFTLKNVFGDYGWRDWFGLVFAKHPQKDAGVLLPFLSKGERRFNQVAGFFISLGITALSGWLFIRYGLPRYLLGALAAGSLKVLVDSFRTDILKPSDEGKIRCGNSAVIWFSDDDDFFPEFSQEAMIKMRSIAQLRGDQGEGIFTWGETEDGDVIPIIYKIMKTKRGKPVILMTHIGFKKEIERLKKKGVKPIKGIRIVTVHDRFATQGRPTEAALQPHLGPIEKDEVVVWNNGIDEVKSRTIATCATENGDYNGKKIRYRTKALSTGEIRELYPQMLHMEKNVFMEPNSAYLKGYYDYLQPGDAKALAVVLHWHINQGNPKAAGRFAYYETMTDSKEERLEYLLTLENEQVLGQGVMGYYQANKSLVSWPQLNVPNKDFNLLWVTKEMVDANKDKPELQDQYEALEAYREGMYSYFLSEMEKERAQEGSSPLGALLNQWRERHEGDFETRLEKFVNMTVERFFTANLSRATREVAEEAHDSFLGVTVRHSLQPKHMSIITDEQSVSLGFTKNSILLNSEHLALMAADGVEEILILNSEKPGQLTDVTFDEQTGEPILIAYDFREKRYLKDEELWENRMELKDNRYAKPNVKRDPKTHAQEDIQEIPKTTKESVDSWKDPKSFNRETNEDWFLQQVSRGIEVYIKKNSTFYQSARGQLIELLDHEAEKCQGSLCSEQEAKYRRSMLVAAVQNDNRVLGYLQSILDNYIAHEADQFTNRLVGGRVNDYELVPLVSRLNKEIPKALAPKIHELVDNLLKRNDAYLNKWSQEDAERREMERKVEENWQVLDDDEAAGVTQPTGTGEGLPELQSIGAGETDVFLSGMGNSLWMVENLKHMMATIWPEMRIESDSANKAINRKPGDRVRLGKRTQIRLSSKSGATSGIKTSMARLKSFTQDRLYIETGDVASVMGLRGGQKYYKGAPFNRRIYVTGHTYTSEVDSTGDVEMMVNQINMVIDLARRWKDLFPNMKLWGFNFSEEIIQKLEQRRDAMVQRAVALTGTKEDGKTKIETPENTNITREATVFGHMLKETFSTNIITRGFIYACGFGLTYLGAKYELSGLKAYVASAVETTIALLFSWGLTTLVYRPLTGIAEKWGWLGTRGVVWGDVPVLSQIAAVSARIWGGNAYSSLKFKHFAANPQDHYAFRHLADVNPGAVQIFGVPDDPYQRGQVLLTAGQANVRYARLGFISTWWIIRDIPWIANFFKRSFMAGSEIFTMGHGEVDPDLRHHHINLGPVEYENIPQRTVAIDEFLRNGLQDKDIFTLIKSGVLQSVATQGVRLAMYTPIEETKERIRQALGFDLPDRLMNQLQSPAPDEQKEAVARMNKFWGLSFGSLERLTGNHVFLTHAYEQARNAGKWELFKQGTISMVKVVNTQTPVGAPEQELAAHTDDKVVYGKFKDPNEAGYEGHDSEQKISAAMAKEAPGGIDMNSQLMDLNVKGKDTLGTITSNDLDFAMKSVAGFVPQVKTVVPISLNMLEVILAQ